MGVDDTTTDTEAPGKLVLLSRDAGHRPPGLLIPFTLPDAISVDRCLIETPCIVGRSEDADLSIIDNIMSGKHFRILQEDSRFFVHDLGSKNGTLLNGRKIVPFERHGLKSGSVIRAGHTLLVFQEDMSPMMHPPLETFDMAGSFHLEAIIEQLETAAVSPRQILLTGPTGVGKELAARALVRLRKMDMMPFVCHNAARFSSEDEAVASLFGVAEKVFSNVKSRPGLIERADNGTLFLDEAQHLPARIQKALLRITEDRKLTRLGESEPKTVNVRFILASNAPDDTHGLVHDLFSRVRKVEIPSLRDRIADIPKIFDAVLLKALERMALKPRLVKSYLKTEHYEALMLHGFSRTNIRGLIDLAERTAARIANGMETEAAVQRTFVETLAIQKPAQGPERVADEASARHNTDHASHYDDHREEITRAYMENKGNIQKTVETLKQRGIGTSRQWLAVYAKLWALPHKRDLA